MIEERALVATLDRSRLFRRVKAAAYRRVGIDPRALGALRIGLGTLVVVDTLLRSRNLGAFYTDTGVLPRTLLHTEFPLRSQLTLHVISGDATVQVALFVLTLLCGLALLAGYRTRLATVACFVLVVSVQARNPLLLDAGDKLLRRLLFWGAFLPLGARYAVGDGTGYSSSTGGKSSGEGDVASLATAALLVQVLVIYVVNAVFKLRGDIWLSGDAVGAVLQLDHYTIHLGDVLAPFSVVTTLATWAWLGLLIASPLLILATGRVRGVIAGAFITAHLGMALTLYLGVFPLVSVASLLVFLPARVWDTVDERWQQLSAHDLEIQPLDLEVSEFPFVRRELPWTSPNTSMAPAETARVWGKRGATAVVAVVLVLVIVWNAMAVGAVDGPGEVETLARDVTWDMFAPYPPNVEAWYVVPGTLSNGSRVDALHGGSVTWERPDDLAETYPTARWLKYLLRISDDRQDDRREAFATHLCRRWQTSHERHIVDLDVYLMSRSTNPSSPQSFSRDHLGSFECQARSSS